ncbi:hypothetical protein AYI68_g1167 [Smittium mucronatum]|uniref:Transcription initiation factor TFIID subunit 4 n=1 Tax=Smittium mucronatum TaxID=133383 RepID=A0A1R0H6D8_9FUNG|nr:hypothetical protein AYI68_g1167 [Smittium mucronatum]
MDHQDDNELDVKLEKKTIENDSLTNSSAIDSLISSIPTDNTPANLETYDFDALFDSVGISPMHKDNSIVISDSNTTDFLQPKQSSKTDPDNQKSSNTYLDKDFNFSIEELEKIMAEAQQSLEPSSAPSNQESMKDYRISISSNPSTPHSLSRDSIDQSQKSDIVNSDQTGDTIFSGIPILSKSNSQTSLLGHGNTNMINPMASSPVIPLSMQNSSPLVLNISPSSSVSQPNLHIPGTDSSLSEKSSKAIKKRNLIPQKKIIGRPSGKSIPIGSQIPILNNNMNNYEFDNSIKNFGGGSIRPKSDFPNLQPNIPTSFLLPNQSQIQSFPLNHQNMNTQIGLSNNPWNPMFRPNPPNQRPNMPVFRPDVNSRQNNFPNPHMRPNIQNLPPKPSNPNGVPAHTYIARLMAQLPPNKQIQLSQSLMQLQSNVISTKTFLDRATSILGPELTTLLETLFNKPQTPLNNHNQSGQSAPLNDVSRNPSQLPNLSKLNPASNKQHNKNPKHSNATTPDIKTFGNAGTSSSDYGILKSGFESTNNSQNPKKINTPLISDSLNFQAQNNPSYPNLQKIQDSSTLNSNTHSPSLKTMTNNPAAITPQSLHQKVIDGDTSNILGQSSSPAGPQFSMSANNVNSNQNYSTDIKNFQNFDSLNAPVTNDITPSLVSGSLSQDVVNSSHVLSSTSTNTNNPKVLKQSRLGPLGKSKIGSPSSRAHLSTIERLELIIKDGILSLEALSDLSKYLSRYGEEIATKKDSNGESPSDDQIKSNMIRIQNLQSNISLRQSMLQQSANQSNQQSKPLLNIPFTQIPQLNKSSPSSSNRFTPTNSMDMLNQIDSLMQKDKKMSKYKLAKIAKNGGDISSLLMHYSNFNKKNKLSKRDLKTALSGNHTQEIQNSNFRLMHGTSDKSTPVLDVKIPNQELKNEESFKISKNPSLASLHDFLDLNKSSNSLQLGQIDASNQNQISRRISNAATESNKRSHPSQSHLDENSSSETRNLIKKQKNSASSAGGGKDSNKNSSTFSSTGLHDSGPVSTGIDDVMGIAGVDLRKESENILHESLIQSQRNNRNDSFIENDLREPGQKKLYSIIINGVEVVKEPGKGIEFLNEANLDDRITMVAQDSGIKKIGYSVTEIISLAVEYRLRFLIKSMISAAYHRMRTQTIPPPPLNQLTKAPLYRIVPSFDLRKQLSALERIDRNSERKFLESLLDPESIKNNTSLGSGASRSVSFQNKSGIGDPSSIAVEELDSTKGHEGASGKQSVKQKRKRVSNSGLDKVGSIGPSTLSLAYAAMSGSGGSGSMLSARNMPDEVRNKITNQTALMSAGGIRKSWMMPSHSLSEWKSPSSVNSSFPGSSQSSINPTRLKQKKSKLESSGSTEEPHKNITKNNSPSVGDVIDRASDKEDVSVTKKTHSGVGNSAKEKEDESPNCNEHSKNPLDSNKLISSNPGNPSIIPRTSNEEIVGIESLVNTEILKTGDIELQKRDTPLNHERSLSKVDSEAPTKETVPATLVTEIHPTTLSPSNIQPFTHQYLC